MKSPEESRGYDRWLFFHIQRMPVVKHLEESRAGNRPHEIRIPFSGVRADSDPENDRCPVPLEILEASRSHAVREFPVMPDGP